MENRIKIQPTIYNQEKVHTHKIKMIDGSIGILKDSKNFKTLKSHNYNYFFDKVSGLFQRWGNAPEGSAVKPTKEHLGLYLMWKTFYGKDAEPVSQFFANLETDADISRGLPEIADIEISTACRQGCAFCYKANGAKGENMTLETFKKAFHKLPKTVTQIAFGITDIDANPDMWDIFDYTYANGIIPNVTINGSNMTAELYDKLASKMGAVAVSVYDKDISYNAIKELTDRGMNQVNIHYMIHRDNFEEALQVLKDKLIDTRLNKLNAIVLLSMKPKGRAKDRFQPLSQEKYTELINFALDNNIGIGADSCGCWKFWNAIKDDDKYNKLENYLDPCESTVFSSYLNVNANFSPCSFTEGNDQWENGISVVDCEDFLKDIWYHKNTNKFRDGVVSCRECKENCSIYEV